MGVELTSVFRGSTRVTRRTTSGWLVRQRPLPPPHDNAQAATWVRIENDGAPRPITIEIAWASRLHMATRGFGYLQRKSTYSVVHGLIGEGATRYELIAPPGLSHFGPVPWYGNEDAERFLRRMERKSPYAEAHTLGTSGESRPIRCLRVRAPRARNRNVLLLAREHATETSGSFAVEAVVDLLLGNGGGDVLREGTFHIVPVANPDGVANGLKLTRVGPVEETDMYKSGRTSSDPAIRALRDAVLELKPACIVPYHSYLDSTPACMFFNKADGLAMLNSLLDTDTWIRARGPVTWKGPHDAKSVWHVNRMPRDHTLWGHCAREFGSVVNMPELSWHGRTPEEIRALGLASFRAAMHALRQRDRAPT